MIISVDFDGTCVTHDFPETGKNIGAEIVLKALDDAGHKIICLSMRSDEHTKTMGTNTIQGIKNWFKKEGISLYAINDNPSQVNFSNSRKVYAHTYIDDQFLGCPLKFNPTYSDRFFVDWYGVAIILNIRGFLSKEEVIKVISELEEKYPELYVRDNHFRDAIQDTKKQNKTKR